MGVGVGTTRIELEWLSDDEVVTLDNLSLCEAELISTVLETDELDVVSLDEAELTATVLETDADVGTVPGDELVLEIASDAELLEMATEMVLLEIASDTALLEIVSNAVLLETADDTELLETGVFALALPSQTFINVFMAGIAVSGQTWTEMLISGFAASTRAWTTGRELVGGSDKSFAVALNGLDWFSSDGLADDEAADVVLWAVIIDELSEDTAAEELCVCVELAINELERLPPLDLPLHTFKDDTVGEEIGAEKLRVLDWLAVDVTTTEEEDATEELVTCELDKPATTFLPLHTFQYVLMLGLLASIHPVNELNRSHIPLLGSTSENLNATQTTPKASQAAAHWAKEGEDAEPPSFSGDGEGEGVLEATELDDDPELDVLDLEKLWVEETDAASLDEDNEAEKIKLCVKLATSELEDDARMLEGPLEVDWIDNVEEWLSEAEVLVADAISELENNDRVADDTLEVVRLMTEEV
ncbi:hypothetical protein CC86DRAFT_413634 [Ophiobolus disseminans]|uniref:Uncharacterized protein n=1 Tax=Ophiobolus disseminans TaxID=1469910 RepID=A0A6A6ZEY1_9PLEO|nr:hypothetical protein CC86DRAFT_413634 [Ophiobolus disseminans]